LTVGLETCDTTIDSRDVVPDDFTPDNPQDPELTEKLALLRTFSQQRL
jgi:ferredoxin--NADP+ reductase